MLKKDGLNSVVIDSEDAVGQKWDFLILGAGMGGSAAAFKLAMKGRRVLLIEKGQSVFDQIADVAKEEADPNKRLAGGRWPTRIRADVDGRKSDIWAPLGCGVGGSTLLYAAALQRLRRSDFELQTLPSDRMIKWPFTYEELEPYYLEAEALFSVCGTSDPSVDDEKYDLLPPPKLTETDESLFAGFESAGLHPYRLHTGIKYEAKSPDATDLKALKQDAASACIAPAIASGNLYILDRTEVESLDANRVRVKQVLARRNGKSISLSAENIILSAGAYFSPMLLQKSANEHWPNGLANDSDMVGRNLMFHASDFIAVWPVEKRRRDGPSKTLAFRDLYKLDGKNLGEFQSTGHTAKYGNVLYALRLIFDQSAFRKLSFVKQLLRIPAYIAAKFFGEATVFSTIVEDYPYPENRILLDQSAPSGMRFQYHFHDEFRERVLYFRKLVRIKLKPLRSLPMATNISLNYGHPCGTCVAGDDPSVSVLDKNCKAHSIDNLYILDASFMPTSGGTNPSLTIAANALRVADKLAN